MNILEFSRTISDDVGNYDLNGACKDVKIDDNCNGYYTRASVDG